MLTGSDECRRLSGWVLTGAYADAGQVDNTAGTLTEESTAPRVGVCKMQARLTVRRVCRQEARKEMTAARLVPL